MAREVSATFIREQQDELKSVLESMKQVLNDYRLVGIAAPQIGVSLRIFLMQFKENSKENLTPDVYKARDMSPMPLTVRTMLEIR